MPRKAPKTPGRARPAPHRSLPASLAADVSPLSAPQRRHRKTAPQSFDLRRAFVPPANRLANASESRREVKLQSLSARLLQRPVSDDNLREQCRPEARGDRIGVEDENPHCRELFCVCNRQLNRGADFNRARVRRACLPSGSKTRGRFIVFETLLAVEQPNKEDSRPHGQDVKKIADDAADGNQ